MVKVYGPHLKIVMGEGGRSLTREFSEWAARERIICGTAGGISRIQYGAMSNLAASDWLQDQ